MLHSGIVSWPWNQLACICRKIGASERSAAGGDPAAPAAEPVGRGLVGRRRGIRVPSGVTKPSATCTSGEAARTVGYATVGDLMAPFASVWTGSSIGAAGGADVTGGDSSTRGDSPGMGPGHAGVEPGHAGAGESGPGAAGAGEVGTGRRCNGNGGSE